MLDVLQMLSLPFLALGFIALVTGLGYLTFRDYAREAREQRQGANAAMRKPPRA